MTFDDVFVSKAKRYSLGTESETGKHYLSIPVSNDEALVDEFLKQCRNHENDLRLFMQPGRDCGVPL